MAEHIGPSNDIAQGHIKAFKVKDEKVLVYHLSDGFYATQANCTHLFWSLKKGEIIDDRCVQCPFHHAHFNIRTGEVEQWAVRPPGVQLLNGLRSEKALQTWPVEEKDGQLYLSM